MPEHTRRDQHPITSGRTAASGIVGQVNDVVHDDERILLLLILLDFLLLFLLFLDLFLPPLLGGRLQAFGEGPVGLSRRWGADRGSLRGAPREELVHLLLAAAAVLLLIFLPDVVQHGCCAPEELLQLLLLLR